MRGSIVKKGNSYYIIFRRHDPETGKKKQKWVPAGKSKRKAEKMLVELIGQVHDGSYRELVKSTFADFADLWISSYAKTKCKPSTLASYEHIIEKHLKPVAGDYLLTEITTGMLQRYVATRLEKVKPKTVINEIVVLHEMLKHAVRWGYLKINPAEYLERPKVEREEMNILSPSEFNLFIEIGNPRI